MSPTETRHAATGRFRSDGVGRQWLAAAAAAAVLGLLAALLYTGAASPQTLSDAGALTRWALPVAKTVHNLAIATVISALVFAVVILPHRADETGRQRRPRNAETPQPVAEHPAFARALSLAGAASVAWTLAAAAVMVLSYSDIAGQPLSAGREFTSGLAGYLTDIPVGQAWLATTVIASAVTTLVFGIRSLTGLAATAVLAVLGLVPTSLTGHAAGGEDHYGAVSSLGLHVLGVALWVGGMIVLAVVSGTLGQLTVPVVKRYSALAAFAFALVVLSGVINATTSLSDWSQLTSGYGLLVVFKTLAAVLLGLLGLVHRQWIIPRLGITAGGRPAVARSLLWRLIAVELVIMGAVSGLAVALSRTAPPVSETLEPDATPARILTGYDLPPELTTERWLSEWRFDWLWIAFALTVGGAYLLGVRALRCRGDSWPPLRTISWLAGLAALVYVTSGAPAVYGMVLFSAHMTGHMVLTMVVPILLVPGAPVTLALKALPARRDGSRGIREWILVLVHSRFSALVTHPLFAAANFAGSLVLFYYTPLFGLALRSHPGHELMNLHFLITGYLFVLSMIGSDPIPRRAPYPLRLVLLFATMAFHAFFGVALTGGTTLLQASWFGNMGREWGLPALADQQMGGAVTWGIGEVPTLLLAVAVAIMWSRSDARETRRKDRAAERNNDADLTAYNDMFARLAERDRNIRG